MSDLSDLRPSEAPDGVPASAEGAHRGAELLSSRGRRRLQAEWTVIATLGRALSPGEVTRAVLVAALEALDADVASIAVTDGDREGALRVTDASRGLTDAPHRIVERSLPLADPVPIATVAREGRPVFREAPASRQVADVASSGGEIGDGGALAAVPLIVAGRVFGALSLGFRDARSFDDDERTFVLAVAQQYAEATERARLFDAEHSARARAEAASRTKSEFLAMMSHEIRTPLNAVVGYTDLLDMGIAGPVSDPQREYLARIRASSKHLLTIVNDMLDLSKVEAGRLIVANSDSSARAAVEAAVAIVHAQAVERSIALVTRHDAEGDVRYCGDVRRVEQILLNLLSNALRFTRPGGRITVVCRPTDPSELRWPSIAPASLWCAIDVEDTGIGIAEDHLPSIFDPFVQVDTGLTRAYGGSGLGLAISRRLARAMDGDIVVKSVLGEGSPFTLLLPAPEGERVTGAARWAAPAATGARPRLGLTDVGDAVLAELEVIVKHYMERLRTDPLTPSAHAMKDTELQDHSAIFVSDIAQALGIAQEADGRKSTLVRHDHEIQNLIADRHGELRQHLGWSEAELERDFEIMWEEIEQAVRRVLPRDEASVEEGLALLKTFVDRADEISRRAYRRKAAASPSASRQP